jgi:acetyl-CoA carboxylase carboxyl transferase subunit alpha
MYLDFEQPIVDLENKIEELERIEAESLDLQDEIARLKTKLDRHLQTIYGHLTPWQTVQVARHHKRPKCSDYIEALIEQFTPLAGDRCYGEDKAIIAGLGRFEGHSVMVIGQERGRNLDERITHNFGMAHPEGYRKASRLMGMAERFGLPVITFIDTPGAYPGIGAEERGQAEAIARCIEVSLSLSVPVIALITGEGGSGGAIALACADRIVMMQHAVYSVISPEGCASILWRTAEQAPVAAEALKITAKHLKDFGFIDTIVPEPLGGAHRHPGQAFAAARHVLRQELAHVMKVSPAKRRVQRQEKFLAMTRAA